MASPIDIDNLGIPPLAGLCDYEEASKPGLSVETTVRFLKRLAYVKARLNRLQAAHLPRTPEWEVKCALGLHLWLDAEHATICANAWPRCASRRLASTRCPIPVWKPGSMKRSGPRTPSSSWPGSPRDPAGDRALRASVAGRGEPDARLPHPADRPPTPPRRNGDDRLGRQALAALTATPETRDASGCLGGASRHSSQPPAVSSRPGASRRSPPHARADGPPYEMDPVPRARSAFVEPFNRGAPIDAHLCETSGPPERVLALFAKRLREMDVPEWMAPILYKTDGKPWEYYVDISRQLWDETRHAMLGEIGFVRAWRPVLPAIPST